MARNKPALHQMEFVQGVKDTSDPFYPADFWSVETSGDYDEDYKLGVELADKFIRDVITVEDPCGPNNSLSHIVGSMIKHGHDHARGVRVGFLNTIGAYLRYAYCAQAA